ncbi:MAG: FAD-linked oxidase C-terminal domain-containing protein [Candidatus Eisenbacteria bacterium]|nr:FAD-linked oxidase C-terminal domain-containing protein [Candidatus Eisenbacteria bacterium]
MPDLVALPSTTEDVQAILRICRKYRVPVTPRGAGTGMSGGSVPIEGGVVVSMERMNSILSLCPEENKVTVGPGLINGELQKVLMERGHFFPPDPSSMDFSSIGGNVALNASGPRCFKYGATKRYVEAFEFVTIEGDVLEVDARNPLPGLGDMLSILVGSEGTLGVLTRLDLRTVRLPEMTTCFLANFKDFSHAGGTVSVFLSQKVIPSVIEIIDGNTVRCVEEFARTGLASGDGTLMLVEVDGPEDEVRSGSSAVEEILRSSATYVRRAEEKGERDKLWKLRKSISPSLARIGPTKINEDVCVPRTKIPELASAVDKMIKKYGLKIFLFGHAGDGNIHVNIMTDRRNLDEMKRVEEAVRVLFDTTLSLGGTLSGEHGIGLTKKEFLKDEVGEYGMMAFRKVKDAFDPAGMLNPGKLLDSTRFDRGCHV